MPASPLVTLLDLDGDALHGLRGLPVRAVGLAPAQYAGADTTLARALVRFAHDLGLQVLATGVDDRERLQRARAAGCDLRQGASVAGAGGVDEGR